jgi:hypothetical protein
MKRGEAADLDDSPIEHSFTCHHPFLPCILVGLFNLIRLIRADYVPEQFCLSLILCCTVTQMNIE